MTRIRGRKNQSSSASAIQSEPSAPVTPLRRFDGGHAHLHVHGRIRLRPEPLQTTAFCRAVCLNHSALSLGVRSSVSKSTWISPNRLPNP